MTNFNLQSLLDGNRRALAKAITLVDSKLESHREQAQDILEQVLPHSGNSIRIGITGVPGVGKSTLLLQVAAALARESGPVVYVTGEESAEQVALRARRIDGLCEELLLLPETSCDAVIAQLESL